MNIFGKISISSKSSTQQQGKKSIVRQGKMKMIISVLFAALAIASATPKFENCQNNPVVQLQVTRFPDPLVLKSKEVINADFKITVSQDLPSTLYAQITMKKKVGWWWMKVPCLKQVGSCEYKVTCDLIKQWAKTDKLPHPCPAPAGITSRSLSIPLPDSIPSLPNWLVGGKLQLQAEIFTGPSGSGQRLGCAKTEVNIRT